jgi:hypothetical protein
MPGFGLESRPSKNRAFPAIRAAGSALFDKKTAVFRDCPGFPRVFGVKADYFTFVKKHVLKAWPDASRNSLPGASLCQGARDRISQ